MPRKVVSQIPVFDLAKDDVCTIVSIVPFIISEFKPGIYPGNFNIPPCLNPKQPNTLLVGTSVHFIPQFNGDDELPAHVVKTSCKEIATSVVNDYLQGQMDIDDDCHPGIYWIPGNMSGTDFASKHPLKLAEMIKFQMNWFGKLVQRADNDWNRYKRHSVISENQRFAARALNLEKDWITPNSVEATIKCPACLSRCEQAAIICPNCKCILKPEEYKKLTFAA